MIDGRYKVTKTLRDGRGDVLAKKGAILLAIDGGFRHQTCKHTPGSNGCCMTLNAKGLTYLVRIP
jgi:hypothetical protein